MWASSCAIAASSAVSSSDSASFMFTIRSGESSSPSALTLIASVGAANTGGTRTRRAAPAPRAAEQLGARRFAPQPGGRLERHRHRARERERAPELALAGERVGRALAL